MHSNLLEGSNQVQIYIFYFTELSAVVGFS